MGNEFSFGDNDVEVHVPISHSRRKHKKVRDVGALFLAEPLAIVIQETPRNRTLQADLGLHKVA
jgi:hypothetical protein